MDFKVRGERDLLHVEPGFREAFERLQRPSLQEFGQCPFERDLEARVGAEARKAPLVLRVQQGHVHDRVAPAEGCVAHEDAEPGLAQSLDTGSDAGVARDYVVRHLRQAEAFADDAVLDMALEYFRQRLAAGFHHRVAGRHAITHIQVADDVHREPGLGAVMQARVGQGADAPADVARVQVDEDLAVDRAVRVVERMQLRVEQFDGPGRVVAGFEPAFLRIVHEGAVGACFPEVEVGPEVVRAEPLEEFAERAGACSQFGCPLAVGKQHRAVPVTDMHRPDGLDGVQPRGLVEVEPARSELGLHRPDGRFKRGVFARDEAFGVHALRPQRFRAGRVMWQCSASTWSVASSETASSCVSSRISCSIISG